MKTKIYLTIISLVMGLSLASCEDNNDFAISTTPILTESSVVTGSSDITATSATLHGSVNGLDNMASSSYAVGFFYGTTQNELTESVTTTLAEGAFSATLTSLVNNSTLYYQAFVRLQGKVYFKGQVKSLITTDAKVATKAATGVDYASATLGGTLTDYPADATCGIVISTSADVEAVRDGLIIEDATLSGNIAIERTGLLPNTKYYYAAYLNLGNGIVYGEVENFTTDTYDFDLENDLVDLGLSVKWARFNVGAKNETDLGGLFGFGDLTGCNNSINVDDYPTTADTYNTAYDIAKITYSGKVTLPSAADFEELFSLCDSEWTEQDGVAGFKLTGPNGNSIFLPAAGSRIMNDITDQGVRGLYMTGMVNPSNPNFALGYEFDSNMYGKTTTARYQAIAIRPVYTDKNYNFTAKLTCYGDGGAPDEWASATIAITAGDSGLGTHTITFNAEGPRSNGKVYLIEIEGYSAAYPEALVRVNGIKADGKEIKFDANKFFYGDIEGKGNYRIELANIWGAGHNDSWDGLKDTPFRKGGGETTNETALAFNSTFEVTFTIASITSNGAGAYTPRLATINPSWGGPWDYSKDAAFEVKYENFQYSIVNPSFDLKYESTDHAAGSIMTFVQVNDIYGLFPGMHATLDNLYLDGKQVTFDAAKVLDANDNLSYRLELWNCYGATKNAGCAFGTPDGDIIKELGFSSSMEMKFTFRTLFSIPEW